MTWLKASPFERRGFDTGKVFRDLVDSPSEPAVVTLHPLLWTPAAPSDAEGAYGRAIEVSHGKDSTTGHWEIAGVPLERPFPNYQNGFSDEVIKEFEEKTGRKVMLNKPLSGTVAIDQYGEEQIKTGNWIVYGSADPVFQIAANEEIIPLEELYKACEIALEICNEKSPVARVIARPSL